MKEKNTTIQMIADYEGDVSTLFDNEVTGKIPLLITRNIVLFPGIITPIIRKSFGEFGQMVLSILTLFRNHRSCRLRYL